MPEDDAQQRARYPRSVLLWTLAVVGVIALVAIWYIGFGRTAVAVETRTSADTAVGRPMSGHRNRTNDHDDGRPEVSGKTVDRPAESGSRTADDNGSRMTAERRADGDPVVGPIVPIRKDLTEESRFDGRYDNGGDDDAFDRGVVSDGPYRKTDGFNGAVYQNVYSTIDQPAAAADQSGYYGNDWLHVRPPQQPVDGHRYGYYGSRPPQPLPPRPRVEIEERPHNTKTDWRTMGAMAALAAVASAKLTAVGLMQFAFVLAFKVFLLAAAVTFKWLLMLKLGKLFHALTVVPVTLLLAASLVPILLRSLQGYNGTQLTGGSTAADLLQTGIGASGGSSGSSSSFSSGSSTLLPGGTMSSSTSIGPLSSMQSSLLGQTRSPVDRPTLRTAFQTFLDADGCVELAACQMAAAEKAGTVPVWINRILNGVSKLVADEKIKLYFKTYNDLNIEMHSTPSFRENWETWCSERFDCFGANATTTTNK